MKAASKRAFDLFLFLLHRGSNNAPRGVSLRSRWRCSTDSPFGYLFCLGDLLESLHGGGLVVVMGFRWCSLMTVALMLYYSLLKPEGLRFLEHTMLFIASPSSFRVFVLLSYTLDYLRCSHRRRLRCLVWGTDLCRAPARTSCSRQLSHRTDSYRRHKCKLR